MFEHAREVQPHECCGLIGGGDGIAQSIYRMRNVSRKPLSAYEAAPEDLFDAQRQMRSRNEELLAIYHSHPRASDPTPSETDVRMAYYPKAIYFIIGLHNDEAKLRAFIINENLRVWEPADYCVSDD